MTNYFKVTFPTLVLANVNSKLHTLSHRDLW